MVDWHQLHNSSLPATAVCAGMSSVITKTLLFPIDTIKCRLQANNTSVALRNLFNGLGPKILLYAPYQSIYMTAYTQARDRCGTSPLGVAASGVVAELAGSVVRVPMETIKQRMQMGAIGSNRDLIDLIRSTPRIFFAPRNFLAQTLVHDIPCGVVHWVVYEWLRRDAAGTVSSDSSAAGSGAVAGATAAILTNPLDVVKTRMITRPEEHPTVRATVRNLWNQKGLKSFSKGLVPRVLHIAPNSALYMFVFNRFMPDYVLLESLVLESLVLAVRPDLDKEEVQWAVRWVEGPLSVPCRGTSVSAISSELLAKQPEVQPMINRLVGQPKGAEILAFLHFIKMAKSGFTPPTVPLIGTVPEERFDDNSHFSQVETPARTSFLPNAFPTELQLVQDLVYVIQGIEGKFIRFHPTKGVSLCPDQLPHVAAAIYVVAEMGVLVRAIGKLCGEVCTGKLEQAFVVAVKREIAEYQKVAALIDADVHKWTLVKLLAWLAIPLRKLRHLHAVVDSVVAAGKQSVVIDILAQRVQARVFGSVYTALLQQVNAHLLEMIGDWVGRGRLHADFFVSKIAPSTIFPRTSQESDRISSNRLWRDTFEVRWALVPRHIPPNLVGRILLSGKSVALLRSCEDWQFDFRLPDGLFTDMSMLLKDMDEFCFGQNLRLVKLLLGKYALVDHCRSIRQFLLLSQGDFVDALVAVMSGELSKSAAEQNRFELAHRLDLALRMSNKESPAFASRVQPLLSFATGITDLGFDVFSLTYSTTSPLDVILTPDAIQTYSRCFQHLFAVVMAEYALSQNWKELMAISKQLGAGLSNANYLLHKSNCLRAELWRLVHAFRAICCYEVVQAEWAQFELKVVHCVDLDALISAHETYLAAIVSGLLLSHGELFLLVQNLLQTVTRFVNTQHTILAELAAAARLREDLEEVCNIDSLLDDVRDAFLRARASLTTALIERIEEGEEGNSELFSRMLFQLGDDS